MTPEAITKPKSKVESPKSKVCPTREFKVESPLERTLNFELSTRNPELISRFSSLHAQTMFISLSMSSKVSLNDISKTANLSISTVSLVLNGKADRRRISSTTQARVRAIAAQLGYQPHQAARDIVMGKPYCGLKKPAANPIPTLPQVTQAVTRRHIALILSDTTSPETLALIPGLAPVLDAADYQLIIITLPPDPQVSRKRISQLHAEGLSGLLCCPTIFPAVQTATSGLLPVIVLWPGAAKAMLAKLASGLAMDGEVHPSQANNQPIVNTPPPASMPPPGVAPKPMSTIPIAEKPAMIIPAPPPINVPAPANTPANTPAPPLDGEVHPSQANSQPIAEPSPPVITPASAPEPPATVPIAEEPAIIIPAPEPVIAPEAANTEATEPAIEPPQANETPAPTPVPPVLDGEVYPSQANSQPIAELEPPPAPAPSPQAPPAIDPPPVTIIAPEPPPIVTPTVEPVVATPEPAPPAPTPQPPPPTPASPPPQVITPEPPPPAPVAQPIAQPIVTPPPEPPAISISEPEPTPPPEQPPVTITAPPSVVTLPPEVVITATEPESPVLTPEPRLQESTPEEPPPVNLAGAG